MRRLRQFVLQLCVLAGTLCAICSQTHASFVSLSDLTYGADSITLDTETGLRWLDVPLTRNRAYNDVAAQFGVGGAFEGFRHATPSEVVSLFNSFGLETGPVNAAHTQFLSFFGATTFQGIHPEVFGMASGSGIVPSFGLDFFRDFAADPINGQPNYQVILGTGGANSTLPFEHMGSFLVQPVPLPPALSLFVAGLTCLGLLKRLGTRHARDRRAD